MADYHGLILKIFLLGLLCYEVAAQSRTNFQAKRFEVCKANTLIKFHGNITDEKDGQYLTFNITIPVAIDENVGLTCAMESVINDETVVPLFFLREKNLCLAASKYLGEYFYEIERKAGIIPRVCPIAAGRYHGQHVYMDYKAITLQTFPFGRIRFTLNAVNNREPKETLGCLLVEVINIPN